MRGEGKEKVREMEKGQMNEHERVQENEVEGGNATMNLLGRRILRSTCDALSSRDKGSMGAIYYIGNPESPFFVALALQFNLSQFLVYDPSSPSLGYIASLLSLLLLSLSLSLSLVYTLPHVDGSCLPLLTHSLC